MSPSFSQLREEEGPVPGASGLLPQPLCDLPFPPPLLGMVRRSGARPAPHLDACADWPGSGGGRAQPGRGHQLTSSRGAACSSRQASTGRPKSTGVSRTLHLLDGVVAEKRSKSYTAMTRPGPSSNVGDLGEGRAQRKHKVRRSTSTWKG